MYLINNVCKYAVIDSNLLDSALTPRPPPVVANNQDSVTLEPIADQPSELTPTFAKLEHVEDPDDSDDWDSDYESFTTASESPSSDDEELTEEQRKLEHEAREAERMRVLEAAGLIIKSDKKPPPRPVRTRSHRRRRAPPVVPEKSARRESKELPSVPEPETPDHSLRLDDAFERYETYKQNHTNLNRLSVASMDGISIPGSPSGSHHSIPRSPSADVEGRSHSHFLNFFGRNRTPANDGETRVMPVISAPILQKDPSASPDTNEEFGTVRLFFISGEALSWSHVSRLRSVDLGQSCG